MFRPYRLNAMDYFSKFLRTAGQPSPTTQVDHAQEFHNSWNFIKVKFKKSPLSGVNHYVLHYQNTLLMPDERQLTKGINSTEVPVHLRSMVDSLVWESTRIEEGYVCVLFGPIFILSNTLTITG